MWFQLDGAHFANQVWQFLTNAYQKKMDRKEWKNLSGPAQYSDLNPIDFFLCGYMKECVYEQQL